MLRIDRPAWARCAGDDRKAHGGDRGGNMGRNRGGQNYKLIIIIRAKKLHCYIASFIYP